MNKAWYSRHTYEMKGKVRRLDAKSYAECNLAKSIKRNNLHEKISAVSEEEKPIARRFYSRACFQCKDSDYHPVLDLLTYIFDNYGYPRKYTLDYLIENDFILVKSRQEILSRFAVLQLCGIDELTALSRPRLLVAYTDEIIYKAMKQMQKSGMTISSNSLMEYIPNANFEASGNVITLMKIKSAAELYAKSRGL